MEGFDIWIDGIQQFLEKFSVFMWFQLKSDKSRDVSIRWKIDNVTMMCRKKTEQMIVMDSILLSN